MFIPPKNSGINISFIHFLQIYFKDLLSTCEYFLFFHTHPEGETNVSPLSVPLTPLLFKVWHIPYAIFYILYCLIITVSSIILLLLTVLFYYVKLILMKSNINKLLSKRIKALRAEYSITQQKLGDLSGIDYKHIQLLESKKPTYPRIDTLEKLAKAFKMSLPEFLDF